MIKKCNVGELTTVRELTSPQPDWPRVGLSARCPVKANVH